VRLVRSTKAGMGKTRTVKNICKRLSQSSVCKVGSPVTITVHNALDADDIIERLTKKLGNGFSEDSYCAIHIDIANAVSFVYIAITMVLF